MVDRDVLQAKIAYIDRCLERIAAIRSRAGLLPIDVQEITELNLQRAVQAAIDLATHVVVANAYGSPDSAAGMFTLLEQRGVIEPELARSLRRMVGFRNIAVHEYASLDPAIVESIVERHLGDLRVFAKGLLDQLATG